MNSRLENINIVSGQITGNNAVGAIVGYAQFGSISNCRSGAKLSGNIGVGLIGESDGTKILSSYNYGLVSGQKEVGGIVGKITETNPVTISGCYVRTTITAQTLGGGIVGYIMGNGSKIEGSGFEGEVIVEDERCLGAIIGGVDILNAILIENCLTICSQNLMPINDGKVNIISTILENSKEYYEGDFGDWTLSAGGQPLPKGLSWLAIGGYKLTKDKLESLGYKKAI